jgi:hypothetical protein
MTTPICNDKKFEAGLEAARTFSSSQDGERSTFDMAAL